MFVYAECAAAFYRLMSNFFSSYHIYYIQNDRCLGYGFIEFLDVNDADYAIQIMSMVKLFTRPLRVSKSSLDKKSGSGS